MRNLVFSRLLPLAICLTVHASQAQTLLVINQNDANTSFVDPVAGKTIANVPDETPGVKGHEVAASLDGKIAYVPIYGSVGVGHPGIDGHEMLLLDVASHKIVDHIDFGHPVRPHCPIMDPKSGNLYVTTELDQTVSIIDPKTKKIIGSIPTGANESHMLAISHDGKRGYTANVGPGSVSVLDLVNRKTVTIIPVAKSVQRITVSADDKLVFTADQAEPRMAVIDTAANKITSYIPLAGKAYGTAATPDGKWLLVTLPAQNQVAIVDLHTMQVVRSIDVPPHPQEILIAPGAKTAYVSCNTAGQVAALDLAAWKVDKTISTGAFTDGLAWAKK